MKTHTHNTAIGRVKLTPQNETRLFLGYAEWMKAVDRVLNAQVGLSANDLSDFRSRDLYDEGISATEAAEEALANDDMFNLFDF